MWNKNCVLLLFFSVPYTKIKCVAKTIKNYTVNETVMINIYLAYII